MIKRFSEWSNIKEKLHNTVMGVPFVSEGDMWWVSFGENIGAEINGKDEIFSRPGLILKKFSKELFLVLPVSTKIKKGTWFIDLQYSGINVSVCLHQVRMIDYRRLSNRICRLNTKDFGNIKNTFLELCR